MSFTHIDCFSGPGGICTGLRAAGFETLVAIEFIESCCETYKKNHPDVHVIYSDIRNVEEEDIHPFIPEEGVDLVTSGMPCETFSTAGNTSRSFYDDRQFLFREGIRIAKIANAKMVLFENVPGITTKTVSKDSKELIVDVLISELEEAGYRYHEEFVLDASRYGVPQKRKRFFVLASREKCEMRKPEEGEFPMATVSDAIDDLPIVIANSGIEGTEYRSEGSEYAKLMKNNEFWGRCSGNDNVTYQMPMKHRKATLERFSLLEEGESLKNLFERYHGAEREELQSRRVLPKKMFIKRNYRLIKNEPLQTS